MIIVSSIIVIKASRLNKLCVLKNFIFWCGILGVGFIYIFCWINVDEIEIEIEGVREING